MNLNSLAKLPIGQWLGKMVRSPLSQADLSREDIEAYAQWRQRFLHQRLQLGLPIALTAYLTFIILGRLQTANNPVVQDSTWLAMAGVIEFSLCVCLLLLHRPIGRRYPEIVFLGASWSVTLIEQVWATLRGYALPGLFAWTLVFLTQTALLPVRWPLHLISQLGVLGYYFGVNAAIGLHPSDMPLWDMTQGVYLLWFCSICDLSVFLYERLQRAELHARRELEAEQERSERLLLNILPAAIAQQLKQEKQTIAESFAEATVLFADIVGFTQLSAGIPPQELVIFLNQIFSKFDQLAEQHGLEKIKTIGDSYMVVGGLPIARSDHIEAIAEMAIDMQQAIAALPPDLIGSRPSQPIQIRIGINTGPVVAGVIGTKKFIYDLWGDTVNVASRMESQGLAGQIQVTQTVYERLKDGYLFQHRGLMLIKGKGEMTTYLLQGRQRSDR
jgi:adenylate cyclase